MPVESSTWPSLSSPAWPATYETLHLWTQIVGKIRLALGPPLNHWWGVALYLTARGLTTSPMPVGARVMEMRFDFIEHALTIDVSDGRRRTIPLVPQTVADFHAAVMRALDELDLRVHIWPMPVELPSPVRFTEDRLHGSYDRGAAHDWWRALLSVDGVLKEFRGRFIGKSSPVHFWWGGFDLAVTRFSGRRAPERPGADAITREGYSHEVISAGFWPGRHDAPEPAFYAYAAPEPAGFPLAHVEPAEAFYDPELKEFLLRYADVRAAPSPRETLLAFLETTYRAGASLGRWNRSELERDASRDDTVR